MLARISTDLLIVLVIPSLVSLPFNLAVILREFHLFGLLLPLAFIRLSWSNYYVARWFYTGHTKTRLIPVKARSNQKVGCKRFPPRWQRVFKSSGESRGFKIPFPQKRGSQNVFGRPVWCVTHTFKHWGVRRKPHIKGVSPR